jgi:hypothetical protein
MSLNFHQKLILSFCGFFIISIFMAFVFKVYSEDYHTEIIYYDGFFEKKNHFRARDAYILIMNNSQENIYLQYKKKVWTIHANSEEFFDVRNLSPVFIYKNKEVGMRSTINKFYNTLK